MKLQVLRNKVCQQSSAQSTELPATEKVNSNYQKNIQTDKFSVRIVISTLALTLLCTVGGAIYLESADVLRALGIVAIRAPMQLQVLQLTLKWSRGKFSLLCTW